MKSLIKRVRIKTPIKRAKEKAWKAFSEWIRRKDAVNDYNRCVTCGDVKHWKELQAGHFVDGRNNSVLFNEDLVFPQCYHCNVGLRGNKLQYVLYMKRRFGLTDEDIERMDGLRFEVKKMRIGDYAEIEDQYRDKLAGLDITKG